jgi:hypothetical protein
MAGRPGIETSSLLVEHDQPLIGVILEEEGREVVRYFADEAEADAALAETRTQLALSAIGSFRDLDWDEMIDELDRIRHESSPTPPIEL